MIYVVLAANDSLHDVLKRGVAVAAAGLPSVHGQPCGMRLEAITLAATRGDVRDYFDKLAPRFEKWLSEDRVTALVSDMALSDLEPMTPNGNQGESLLAMLILAFPEVRWLFAVVRGEGAARFLNRHGLYRLFKPDETPLFDGLGLRDCVRKNIIGGKKDSGAFYLPERTQRSVAMDEETDYAYLHAWAAYRFGFRAQIVGRMKQAEEIFVSRNNNKEDEKGDLPCLVFEDLYLNFPDDNDKGLSDLKYRSEKFPGLDDVSYRVLVTSGHDVAKQRANRSYVRERRDAGQSIRYLYKPHAGIFSFWKESGFSEKRFRYGDIVSKRPGIASGFQWPPKWPRRDKINGSEHSSGHSSPGILVEIARHMLKRAERMLNDGVSTVEQAVRGAVLANDALELLGCKTPTMSAQALALKHQFELHAECQFCGIDHHLELEDRLKEIERDAEAISRWFDPKARQKTALNIRLDVINKLVRILREYNQFDEERICLNRARHIHNTLFMLERPWGWAAWPFLRYSEWLLSSFPKFLVAIGAWVLGLWGLYSALPEAPMEGDLGPFGKVIGTFFSVDPLPEHLALSSIAVVAGLFHLGVFISMLYELLSRR